LGGFKSGEGNLKARKKKNNVTGSSFGGKVRAGINKSQGGICKKKWTIKQKKSEKPHINQRKEAGVCIYTGKKLLARPWIE